jgi:hypothetical protein
MSRAGKHGPTLQTWRGMLSRCRSLKEPNYGGRGIKVCKRWQSYDNFLADMGERPAGKSIDRIDTNGHYEPGNCRWATAKEQGRNTRANVFFEYEGEKLCIAEIAERCGVDQRLIGNRLFNGWSLDRAIATPAWAGADGEPVSQLQQRMKDFQRHRQALHAIGLTADEIANRVPRRAA